MRRSESLLRASDADRDAAIDRLRAAAGEGRLEPEEFEDRVETALRARTHPELARLFADLPVAAGAPWLGRRAVRPAASVALAGAGVLVAITVAVALVALIAALVIAAAIAWIAVVVLRRACASQRRFPAGGGPGGSVRSGHPRPTGLL